jgi:hypothetical protein
MMRRYSACAVLLIAASGCGRSGIQATGTVTFGGEPLAAGSAAFEPVGDLATVAPACTAPIVDGSFQTPDDRPLMAGKYEVWIRPAELSIGVTNAPQQFTPWKTEVTLVNGGGPIAIDVPVPKK